MSVGRQDGPEPPGEKLAKLYETDIVIMVMP